MGDTPTDNELPGSIVETFVLAIELVGYEVNNGPDQISRILKNPAVEKKIKEALEKRLGELQKKATLEGRPIDSSQALEEIKSVFTVDTLDLTTAEIKKELEKTAKYRQLKASLDKMSSKFKAAPLGFFYDEAEGVLLVVTVGMMLASAVGMYIAATGDADTPLALAGKLAELPTVPIGKIDLGLTDIVLKPSEKKYEGGLKAKVEDLKVIKLAELKVVVQTKDEKVAAVPISVETKVAITPRWFNTFGATYEPIKGSAAFSLGIVGKLDGLEVQVKANYAQEDKKRTYGATGAVDFKPIPSVPLNVTTGLGVSRIDEEMRDPFRGMDVKSSKTDVKVNLGLKVEF